MDTGAPPAPPTPPPTPPPVPPELLEAGPSRGRRSFLPLVVGLAVLVVAGLLGWQFWPRPLAPVTSAELQGIYAGMVRGDGVNEAAPVDLRRDAKPHAVSPAECLPLFDVTALDGHPAEAQDGVGTFWTGDRVGAALTTYRFVDAATARRAYVRIETALSACDARQATIEQDRRWTVSIQRTTVDTRDGIEDQLGYLYATRPDARFAVHVLRYENLLTWQFRYDTVGDAYAPLPAQQIMDSLLAQTKAVVDLRA